MISDVITLVDFLKCNWEQYQTISALFDHEGNRLEGDESILVERIRVENLLDKWFYRIRPVEGYVFVYMPLIPSVSVDIGTVRGEQNPNADFFRFVGNIFSPVISGGNANVKVDFLVVGYRPKDLLGRAENRV